MAVPKKNTFRLVSDYQAVNSQVEQSPGVMPNQEDMRELLGVKYFGKLDLLQGYWHCLLYTSPSPRDRTRSRMPSSA